MAEIRKEIPTGDINGINKTFLLLNTPDFIDDLWIDGAIYTAFSQNPSNLKIITLGDAPISSIFVDYKTGGTVSDIETTCTFGEIKQEVWDLLGQKSTSTNFSDAKVSKQINIKSREIWSGRVVNLLNPNIIYRAGKLYFKDSEINVRIKSGSRLTADFNLGDTEAEMDTTFLLDSGYVGIGGDIIKYTSKTDTKLEGTTGQTIDHLGEETVVQLYEMPVNMDKPDRVEFVSKGSDARRFEITRDNTDSFGRYYQIIRFTNGKTLLKIVGLQNDDLVTVSYIKKYQQMVNNSDLCSFPEDYGLSVVALIVAGSMGYNKGIPNSQQHLNNGYSSLLTMYGNFNDETNVIVQSIKPKADINRIRGRGYYSR